MKTTYGKHNLFQTILKKKTLVDQQLRFVKCSKCHAFFWYYFISSEMIKNLIKNVLWQNLSISSIKQENAIVLHEAEHVCNI